MRTALLAAALVSAASVAQAQAPNAAFDEVAARRKLEERGYRDLRNVTPNGDGTFSAQAVRQNPPGSNRLPSNREVRVEIDSLGNVKER